MLGDSWYCLSRCWVVQQIILVTNVAFTDPLISGRRSLTPQLNGELFWMPWDLKLQQTDKTVPKEKWQIPNYKTFCEYAQTQAQVLNYIGSKPLDSFAQNPSIHRCS